MDWKAKLLAGLRWVKDTVAHYVNIVIDPPPAAIKWYIVAVLVIAVGGGILFAPIVTAMKWALGGSYYMAAPAKPLPLIAPSDIIISVPPPAPTAGPPHISRAPAASASPKDLPEIKTIVVETQMVKTRKVRKSKAVTSAREDMLKALAR